MIGRPVVAKLLQSRLIGALALLAAVAAQAQDVTVYDDALQNGFVSWSYGGGTSFASTGAVHTGSYSISFDQSAYSSAISFAHPGGSYTVAQYPTLHFWVHGGATGNQKLQVVLQLGGVIQASAALDTYITGGAIAAGAWREVTVGFALAPLSYSGSFDRVDLEGNVASPQPILYVDDVSLVPNAIQIEHDVTVASMVSDRFTWLDGANQPRVAVLAHNDGQTGPGGTRGGELREFRYQTPGGQRVVAASSSGASGFGYVVSHPDGTEACMPGAPDTSALGHFISGTFTRVFEGLHHAILRFTQTYPRYCALGAAPVAPLDIPVTMEWVFSTGHDNPLWALTWDLSGVPADALSDDSRGPYGELLFDGAASEAAQSTVAGVGWGDRYKFASTTNPVTMNSAWTWNVANTIPYVKLWTTAVDATMGTVQTQTITQQDAGGYWGTNRWNTTSAGGNACTVAIGGVDHLMPCDFNWPYQSINYSLSGVSTPTSNSRLAWGTNFGFLGQTQYLTQGSAYYGGPLPDTTAPGWPRKSYSNYVVLGTHSSGPVEGQVTQVETVQSLTLSATVGSVVTSGPAGAARADNVTYAPAGYNHVYGALAFAASGNRLDANIAVGTGTLKKPLLILGSYTGAYPTIKLDGVTLVSDVDYFPSLRAGASELWITLNRDLLGATNHLEVLPSCSPVPTPTIQASGPATFCAGGSVTLTASIAPGAGVSYLWSPGGETTQAINVTASGSYSVTVTVTGCAGTSPATVVTVNPIPSAPTASNSGPYCAGGAISLAVSTVAGATYSWTGPSGYASTVQNPTISNATTAMAGTYSVTATVGSCTSAAATTNVVVNPIPGTPIATNNGPLCAGGSLNLTTPTVSGATYAWTGPNGFASTAQNPTIGSVTTAAAGTYSVTATVNGCTSAAGTTSVTVNPVPTAPTAGNGGPYCAGATLSLTASTVTGATYSWTGPNAFTSTSQNPSIPNATTAATGTYSVTVTVNGCTSPAGTTNVVVNAALAAPAVTAPSTVGADSPDWTASVPAHAGSTYAWGITNGTITGGAGTSQITFTAGAAGTPLTLSVTETDSSGCTSAAGTATVTVLPAGSAVFFYTVAPCRQLDTRSGSPISPGGTLAVALTGTPCGIPSGATSVSVNAVVTQETGSGHLTIYPADKTQPLASTINFNAGQTRANNAILPLSSDGTGGVNIYNGSGGTVHVVIDVNGFFQ
jgi:PKD domain